MTAKKPLFEWTDREREIMGEENEGFGERLDVALDQEHARTLQFSSVSICPVRSCPPGKSAKSHIPISRRIIKGRPFILRPLIGMYGPPQSCKRKTKNGSWSAPMYSAFISGVLDSGP